MSIHIARGSIPKTCHLCFGSNFVQNPDFFLSRNLRKIQTFGVEFEKDPRFLCSFFEKMYVLISIFGDFGDQSSIEILFKDPIGFITLKLNLLFYF